MSTGKIRTQPVSLEKVVDLRARGFSLSECGRQLGVSKQAIGQLMKRHGLEINRVENFRRGKALVLHGLQERLIAGITDEEIKKTDVKSRLISFGVAFDKTQLVENRPTSIGAQFTTINIDLARMSYPEEKEIIVNG